MRRAALGIAASLLAAVAIQHGLDWLLRHRLRG